MNDKAVSILEHYDVEILRTCKGRGSIIFETKQGLKVLREYNGQIGRLALQDKLQQNMNDIIETDMIVRNKEGELYSKDTDETVYVVKDYIDGRECSYKSEEDIIAAMKTMAKMHNAMVNINEPELQKLPVHNYVEEMTKHTKECRHIRNYIRRQSSKTPFERALLREYDYFLEKAAAITQMAMEEDMSLYEKRVGDRGLFFHGDYQYHNVLFPGNNICVINFEKFGRDSGVRDLYLLFRKISEKSNWSISLGNQMLEAYYAYRDLEEWELKQLYYRLSYPDKFWKIVNFYYNSRKAWIPDKNLEKLENLISQEKEKEKLLHTLFSFF